KAAEEWTRPSALGVKECAEARMPRLEKGADHVLQDLDIRNPQIRQRSVDLPIILSSDHKRAVCRPYLHLMPGEAHRLPPPKRMPLKYDSIVLDRGIPKLN